MPTWRRNTNAGTLLTAGNYWNDAIAAGDTYMRVHIRWGFHVDSPINVDIAGLAENLVSFGLCTMIGNGTENPPNAREASYDVDPPTQRWIYWETRAPVVSAVDQAAGVITWRDSGATEPTDTKGQVLAASIPAGDSLNLWASWATAADFLADYDANASIWHAISILKKS